MRDLGIINHASVKVTIDSLDWLADSSLLCNVPLPLDHGVFVHDDAVFAAEVEFTNGTHVVWSHTPPNSTYLPCRLIEERTSHSSYLARYEESRARSPFNQRLYARRNRPGEILVLLGNTRFSKTVDGVESRDLSPDEVCEDLHDDIGLSTATIDEWVRSGGLAASFRAALGPQTPTDHPETAISAIDKAGAPYGRAVRYPSPRRDFRPGDLDPLGLERRLELAQQFRGVAHRARRVRFSIA